MKNKSKLFVAVLLSLAAASAWAGNTRGNDPHGNSPSDSSDGGCGGCGSSRGMPTYSFKSMLASLSIRDTPLGYAPPLGPKVAVTLTYNQREADQPAQFDAFNLGPKWTLNWRTYIRDDPAAPGSRVLRYVAGGGARPYTGYNASTHTFAPETDNGAVLVLTSTNPVSYELRFADGSKDVFAQSDGKTAYPRKVFLTRIVDARGNALTLSYDNRLRLSTVTDAIGQPTRFQYENASDPLLVTAITDPFGRSAAIAYDAAGRLTSITDVMGMTSSFAYDGTTFINRMTTPYGTTTFAHTEGANGNRTELSIQATDPDGHTERTEYLQAAPGIPFSESRVPAGMSTFNRYLNYRNSYYWDKSAFASACTVSDGHTHCDYTQARIKHFLHLAPSYTLTARVLESVRYPLENRIWYDYPGQNGFPGGGTGSLDKPTHIGRVLDDGSTQLTTFAYNAYGKVTKKIDPDGRETDYLYAPNGIDLIEVRQKTGAGFDTLARYTYNSRHEPLTYTDAAGQTTTYTYNARGQRTSVTDALGHTTAYAYDARGYLTAIVNALGHTQHSFTYDADGRVATDTDAQGYTRRYAYDALDRLTRITYPDGTTRRYVWDRLDLASTTDRQGNTTTYVHDAERHLVAVTDPLGQTTRYAYYPNGRLHTLSDPKGSLTTWARDLEGRVTAKTYAGGAGSTYAYDRTSRLARATDALGQSKIYTYDRADLLTGISYQNAVSPTAAVSYRYDPSYARLTGMADGLGTTTFSYGPAGTPGALELAAADGPYAANDTVRYVYDALGRLVRRTTDREDTLSYDALGRISQESNPLGSFGYSYLGDTAQITARSLTTPAGAAGFSIERDYDGNRGDRQLRRLGYRAANPSGPIHKLMFTHSPEHLVTSQLDLLFRDRGTAHYSYHYRYDYDAAYRLTQVHQAGGDGAADGWTEDQMQATDDGRSVWRYGYDAAGNLVHSSTAAGELSATANALNQLATVNGQSWQYDADGNLVDDTVNRYAWDAENRLIGITSLATGHQSHFRYDGLGRRLAIDEQDADGAATETRYLWCGRTICQARDGNDTVTADYYRQGALRGAQARYYVKNQIGSILGLVDANGHTLGATVYSAYGLTQLTAGTQSDFGYAGMLRHAASGLYLTRYRAYDPATGRWLSRDPIGETGGRNLYAYVGDDPVNYTDPSGTGPVAGSICEFGAFVYSAYDTLSTYYDVKALADSNALLLDQLNRINNRISGCTDDKTRLQLEAMRRNIQRALLANLRMGLPSIANPVPGFFTDLLTSSTVCGIVALLPEP